MEMGGQGLPAEESPGLNCGWYADILLTLADTDAPEPLPQALALGSTCTTGAKSKQPRALSATLALMRGASIHG
jgi:hypothetical protein